MVDDDTREVDLAGTHLAQRSSYHDCQHLTLREGVEAGHIWPVTMLKTHHFDRVVR